MRPDWTQLRTPNCRFDLSNNVCIDTWVRTQFPQIDYTLTGTYPDELPIYRAISQYHNTDIKQIAVGFGLGELIQRIYLHLEVGTVTVVTPTWPMSYIFLDVEKIPYRRVDHINFNQLEFDQLISDPTDTIYLATPNGINSYVFTRQQIQALLKVYRLVILDESYMEFANINESMIGQQDQYSNLIILKTLSKSLSMPGLRLGYAIASSNIIDALQLCRPSCVSNTMTLQLAETAFNLIPEHVSRMLLARNYFDSVYDTIPSNGNYVLFNGPAPVQEGILTKEVALGINRMSLFSLDLIDKILV